MNFKKLMSLFLAVLMLCGAFGSFSVLTAFAADTTEETTGEDEGLKIDDYIKTIYASPAEKLETMTKKTTKGNYTIYADERSGEVAVQDMTTGQILFTNPYDVGASTASDTVKNQIMSQIIVKFTENGREREYSSYEYAALRDQIKVKNIKNGIRVEYTIGREEARRLVPRRIEKERFQTMILAPMEEYYGVTYEEAKKLKEETGHPLQSVSFYLCKWMSYFVYKDLDECSSDRLKEDLLATFPIVNKYDIYVLDPTINITEVEKIEEVIKTACPNYSYEEMDADHMMTEYTSDEENPPVFKMALEYTIDADGFTVRLPANGIRFNESKFQLTNVSVLPYMGAGNNAYDGYTFYPDGSGALFAFEDLKDQNTYSVASKIYGADYAYHKLTGTYQQTVRYPVFGVVENTRYYDCHTIDEKGDKTTVINGFVYDAVVKAQEEGVSGSEVVKKYGTIIGEADVEERTESRGYVAIIEEGDALTELVNYHAGVLSPYDTVQMNFNPRPKDSYNVADAISVGTNSEWTVVSNRKYVGNYKIHYIMLADEGLAAKNELKNGQFYKASWLGMAMAYRDYLTARNILAPLSAEQTSKDIPLYIEAFGAMEVVEKIASIPVEVMKPLTSTQDVITMYEELSGQGATNINFKLTGYANGGMFATVPKKLKWEKAVTKDMSMQELFDYAAGVENGEMGIYPDFDFAYIKASKTFDGFSSRKHAIRTIDDRISRKREYMATQQRYGGFFQLVVSPAYYENFYVKFMENYLGYDNLTGISVGSLGNALNSDFDEDEPYNREDAKAFTTKALEYISGKDESALNVMIDGGNAYTWQYADHILGAALDSSRYIKASYSVPFVGVVLHGYTNFTGTPLNMEGDVNYAKLKAIENGASVYFTLSYQNTQKLKEDFYLSKYYSVRYDIWFDDVVEIYNELNREMKDVQDKIIMDHQFLVGMRVPDVDELDRDLMNEFNSVLDFQNNKAEYEAKQQAEAVADARDKIASVEGAAQRFVKDLVSYYSLNNGSAYLYVTGDRSFEHRMAGYVEARAAYDAVKAEYDAADEAGKAVLTETLANAEATLKTALSNVRIQAKKIGQAIAAIEKEYAALSKLLEDAKSGALLINSTEGCPQSIIQEIEIQLGNTQKFMETELGVRFDLTVDKAEVDTFLRTHIATLAYSCYGDASHGKVGIVGRAENIYEMLVNENYGLLISELDNLRYLEANRELTDDQLIEKYGLSADKTSMDGLILYVKELLGESYQFDPIVATMENGIEKNIKDYFVSMLYAAYESVEDTAVPALNFNPNRLNDKGRLVPNTANINNVTKLLNNEIDAALTGKNGVASKVTDGNYTLSALYTEEQMTALVDKCVGIINSNIRSEDNPAVALDKGVEYLTPDTIKTDVRNYIEGYYYCNIITTKLMPADAGDVKLQVITVKYQTNSSIDMLVNLYRDAYTYNDDTMYKDILTAMLADKELSTLLKGINDSVKDAYGDVTEQLEKAFAIKFAAAVIKNGTPALQKLSYEVEDAEGNKTKYELRTEAEALLAKLTPDASQDEIDALIAEIVALYAKYIENQPADGKNNLPADYDAVPEATNYVYYNLLVLMSEQTVRDIDNYYYDAQLAKADAALRADVAEKVAAIKAELPEGYTEFDVYEKILAVLGSTENSTAAYLKQIASEITHTAEGKYTIEGDLQSYYTYLMIASFDNIKLPENPSLNLDNAQNTKYGTEILDKELTKNILPNLLSKAKAGVKRGEMPNYALSNVMTAEELDALITELTQMLEDLSYSAAAGHDLKTEVAKHVRIKYYAAVLEKLSANKLPSFHVSEIYGNTLNDATASIKDLMYYYILTYSDMTEAELDALIYGRDIGLGDDEEQEASRYLSDDGRIVSVTYGTKNADGTYSAYKTFILNYNNFAVNVEYGPENAEVTYTIPAYGYVVVMH